MRPLSNFCHTIIIKQYLFSFFSVTKIQKRFWNQNGTPQNHKLFDEPTTQNLKILFEENVVLLTRGEEITIRRITLDKLGNIIDTNKDPASIINNPSEFTDSRVEPQGEAP